MAEPSTEPVDVVVYQATDGARGHMTGGWYYTPLSWDINHWSFSRPHETEAMAKAAGEAWRARFGDGGRRGV